MLLKHRKLTCLEVLERLLKMIFFREFKFNGEICGSTLGKKERMEFWLCGALMLRTAVKTSLTESRITWETAL